MPSSDRTRSNNWRFADAGSRFDTSPRVAARDRMPIATTFTRKIMRCRRCGSRVVSNAKRCPYCGKSLIPFYQSFPFWLLVVASLGVGAIYFTFFFDPAPAQLPDPSRRAPIAIGLPDRTNPKEIPIGTSVDCDDIIVTVLTIRQPHTAIDGRPIYEVTVQLYNRTNSAQRLLSTQWVMRTAGGGTIEHYTGQTDSGERLTNGVENVELAPHEVLTTKIYFAAELPVCLVYLINPLDNENDPEISWLIIQSPELTNQR